MRLNIFMKLAFYGAKSLALGMYRAIKHLYPECTVVGFLVSSLKDNSPSLAGLPVMELACYSKCLSDNERKDLHILVATPEDIHEEIVNDLKKHGFINYTCMNSLKESKLMKQYFLQLGIFPALHTLPKGNGEASLRVFQAKYYKDKPLINKYEIPAWVEPIQVGAELTDERITLFTDNIGENISVKNVNYCELTALYWIWKNELSLPYGADYYGLFHYRRILDIKDEEINSLNENNIDVILQYPTLHEPNISEHHSRYIKDQDWEAMLKALHELQPEYAKIFTEILAQPYFYNYNLIISKGKVLKEYCDWLFPILNRTEELSTPMGGERADRYIGYLGENLMTLYFLYNRKNLNIVHTGRIMLT